MQAQLLGHFLSCCGLKTRTICLKIEVFHKNFKTRRFNTETWHFDSKKNNAVLCCFRENQR